MPRSSDIATLLVGAGPAGVSAAVWLKDFGVPFDWVDVSGEAGGMLRRVHNKIDDYPGGIYDGGPALQKKLREHASHHDLEPRPGEIAAVECSADAIVAVEDDGTRHTPGRLILATGTAYRRLGVPGEDEGLGDYVSQSATADAPRFAGREVAVVGGGDAGFEDARRLAEHDCEVTMLLRSCDHRARPAFVEAARQHERVTIAPIPSVVERIEPLDDGCRLHVDQRGESVAREVACLFVRIGVVPALPAGCEALDTDEDWFLEVGDQGRTSDERIFAAGDVTSTALRSVATSVGDGAVVARHCAEDLGFL